MIEEDFELAGLLIGGGLWDQGSRLLKPVLVRFAMISGAFGNVVNRVRILVVYVYYCLGEYTLGDVFLECVQIHNYNYRIFLLF